MMKRTLLMLALLVGAIAAARELPLLAQEATRTPAAHPIVGAWWVDATSGIGLTPHYTIAFHADQTVVATDEDGITWLGAWESKGERRVAIEIVSLFPLDSPFGPGVTYVGQVEVDESGDRFYRPDITAGRQIEGTRINVESAE